MGVHAHLAADHVQQAAVGVDDEGDALVGQGAEAALDAEGLGDGAVLVGEQRVVEAVLLGELALLVDRVGADPDALGPNLFELGLEVAEVAALLGAAVGHRRGVEEQHDWAFGQEVAQLALGAGLVGKLEVLNHVTLFHSRRR